MIKVFNTLSRKKEIFKPLKEKEVSIYCCGVTPYNAPHIGNARPFVTWDVIRRFFKKIGYKVRYIQNFTDVDDKIIKAAKDSGVTWKEISEKYIDVYFKSMDALNVRRADFYPKVSETMDDIIALIERLVDKKFAYVLDNGDVYYSVEEDKSYGKLSGRKLSDMMAGARVEVDSRKRHPMDFALWKAAKPGEPFWESNWGKGRPGWHIECSAMSLKFLGEKFDFHGGGSDLIFPHHENEIAQSQAALGDENSFAQYWLHNGFITVNKEKLSRSVITADKNKAAGNFFMVENVLKKYRGEVVRLFLLQTHYRNPLEFSEERIIEAQEFFGKLAKAYRQLEDLSQKITAGEFVKDNGERNFAITVSKAGGLVEVAERLLANFYAAMEDDFNTALAITYMFELAKEIGDYHRGFTSGEILPVTIDGDIILRVREVFLEMAEIIGLFEQPLPVEEEKSGENELIDALMKIILSLRQEARATKNWAAADKIRDELKAAGVVVEDTPQGAVWKKA